MSCPRLNAVAGQGVPGPVVIAVMDGIGLGPGDEADAVAQARTPTLARLEREALVTRLSAHGVAVGMPNDDDLGNSEVGHNAMGAGRIFDQGAKLIHAALDSGRLFGADAWVEIARHCARHGTPLHFIGLLSDGNVHSHIDHLLALIARADHDGIKEVYIHALLDGRDTPRASAHIYLRRLSEALAAIEKKANRRYRVASGGGRMTITMDRYEADWPMVERGWRTHVLGLARPFSSAILALETLRAESPGIGDQDLPAFVIEEHGRPVGPIKDGAAVVAFNFRGDRMLELVRAFEDDVFDKFPRGPKPDVLFAGMMQYDGDSKRPKRFLVAPPPIACTLGELLADAGVTQLAVSETQKFGHVTYFWNGNRTGAFAARLERYVEIPSYPPPFDARPQMRAQEIAEAVLKELAHFRHVRLNFANGDMLGHTGNFAATVQAVEAVDHALGLLVEPVLEAQGALVVTADHGNADDMGERDVHGVLLRNPDGGLVPKTSHSRNPVPFYVLLAPRERARFTLTPIARPTLGHVASTLAVLLGFAPPPAFLPPLVDLVAKPPHLISAREF
ncbi:MAG: 2,3-bisphosphoglycerate-independent phosphoglycerate mutase [Deltaproteobacteria bacterium]|nr:2,3-bisphosphoglycerate-independent phosphoglycerate mutase [Deltaproteobacteria bacterium]